MTDKKSNTFPLILLIGLLLIGIGVAGFYYQSSLMKPPEPQPQTPVTQDTVAETVPVAEEPKTISFDAKDVLDRRVLGNQAAPIKIVEYSSLTCGHCANFHNTDMKRLKAEYLDTGRAYLVFADFPLNGAAVHASLAARCADKIRYFEFLDQLFAEQDQWAFDPINYKGVLKTMAAKYGLDDAGFEACINDKTLQKALLDARTQASRQFQVNATPTFVINDETKVGGHELLDTLAGME